MALSCVSCSSAVVAASSLGNLPGSMGSTSANFLSLSLQPLPSGTWFLQCQSSPSLKLHSPVLLSTHSGSPRLLSTCQVKNSEDSGEILSGEGIKFDELTLEQDLQIAIEEENYAQAAKIRDNLRSLQEDGKASVLAANARFYNSFRNGDLATMQTLWSKGEHVCVVHPGVSGISGYDLVMGSWDLVWADYEFPLEIEIKDAQVHVRGDLGYVTCIEFVKTKGSSWGQQFVTNVFERVNGQWYICLHHASPVESR